MRRDQEKREKEVRGWGKEISIGEGSGGDMWVVTRSR